MVDDLLSGMGLAIGYGVALSIPLVGGNLALLIWGDPFPGSANFESRLFIGHVFLFPALLATLIGLHLALVAARHHAQFARTGPADERRLLGVPTFPGQAPRSLALLLATAAVLVALGGLVQINPIWLWGPYETWLGTNGAQPDWYLGWLIGGLRLVPGFDVTIGNATIIPNPFWGGGLFPLVVLAALLTWPALERRITGDRASTMCSTAHATRRCAPRSAAASWPGSCSCSSRDHPTVCSFSSDSPTRRRSRSGASASGSSRC